jgi:anhydro-N-acetylmuramic acid kinase
LEHLVNISKDNFSLTGMYTNVKHGSLRYHTEIVMAPLKPLTVIGLNSGTSMDGIDAAAFRIIPLKQDARGNGHPTPQALDVELIDSTLYPMEPELQKKMQSMIASGHCTLEEICRLNVALGEVFAQATLALMKKAGLTRQEIDLIGSHGQTVWHAPELRKFAGIPTRATLQLGEPSVIAARTGIPVIADFRPRDMALGGQGAPLVSFADEVLFGSEGQATGVLNIGGIANITIINEKGEASIAFDTGPGNMLMDRLSEKLFDKKFDEDGKLAAQGKVADAWLKVELDHPYFAQEPPKTTGRELFSFAFADRLIEEGHKQKLSDHDLVATVTALTAASIADGYKRFVLPHVKIERLVLGGGGADNPTLCKMLEQYWPHKIQLMRHEDFGISTKFKEALLFALLAYTTHFGIPNNVPRCTGATTRVCLGKISRA